MSAVSLSPADRGKNLARAAIGIALAKGELPSALVYCESNYGPFAAPTVYVRDAVSAGSTTNVVWAAPLAGEALSDDFVPYARPRSGVELLASALREVAIGTRVPIEIANAMSVGWVGQGGAKPLSSGAFDVTELLVYKLNGHTVLTIDLLRMSNAEVAVRVILAGLLARMQDTKFFSADVVTGTSPAGILDGVTPLSSTGDFATDAAALLDSIDGDPASYYWVMHPTEAAAIGLRNSLLNVGARGGELAGIPVITTKYVPSDSNGRAIILLDAQQILFSAGPVEVSSATSASVQMLDNPTTSSTAPTPTTSVSLFQTNSAAIRLERFISWKVTRPSAVAWIESTNYSST